MVSRHWNGGMLWRTGAWAGLALLVALDGALLTLPATTAGQRDRPSATRRAMAHPSHAPARRTAHQDGVQPISDLIVPR
jgi:hypothetical protein